MSEIAPLEEQVRLQVASGTRYAEYRVEDPGGRRGTAFVNCQRPAAVCPGGGTPFTFDERFHVSIHWDGHACAARQTGDERIIPPTA